MLQKHFQDIRLSNCQQGHKPRISQHTNFTCHSIFTSCELTFEGNVVFPPQSKHLKNIHGSQGQFSINYFFKEIIRITLYISCLFSWATTWSGLFLIASNPLNQQQNGFLKENAHVAHSCLGAFPSPHIRFELGYDIDQVVPSCWINVSHFLNFYQYCAQSQHQIKGKRLDNFS